MIKGYFLNIFLDGNGKWVILTAVCYCVIEDNFWPIYIEYICKVWYGIPWGHTLQENATPLSETTSKMYVMMDMGRHWNEPFIMYDYDWSVL